MSMGDSGGAKPKELPSWQLRQTPTASIASNDDSHKPRNESAAPSRASLIEKSSRFLKDGDIILASRERKVEFLRTKGLTDAEISELLAKDDQAMKPAHGKDEKTANEALDEATVDRTANGNVHATDASSTSDIDIMDDYVDYEPLPATKEDRPPIITYPEFVLQSQKSAPLITTDRLVSAFYMASGTAATMYGLSKYILEPMVESLTVARHSFFESASGNVDKLNEKLADTVSKVPDGMDEFGEEDASNDGSLSSDPARFFSRTIATQTSPRLSRSTSSVSLNEKMPLSIAANHTEQISKMHDLLSELKHEEDDGPDEVKENFRMLMEYLNDLSMLGRTGQVRSAKTVDESSEPRVDGVAKVKAEIKSVKGVLLSAKNFPAGATSR